MGFGVWLAYVLIDVIFAVVFALIIASAIEPGKRFLARFHIPSVGAVVIIFLLFFSIFGFFFYSFFPIIIEESGRFIEALPRLILTIQTWVQSTPIGSFFTFAPVNESIAIEQVVGIIQSSITAFATGIGSITNGVITTVLILLLSFLFAVQEEGVTSFIRTISPSEYEEYVADLWERTKHKIGLWIQGQLLLGLIVGVSVYVGLLLIGVPNALFFAFFAAVLELIPLVGPVLSAIPPLLMALISPDLGTISFFLVLALFIIIQQVESNLLQPLIITKMVGVPSVLVILSIVIGGSLAGLAGVIVAVPIAACVVEFWKDVRSGKSKPPARHHS